MKVVEYRLKPGRLVAFVNNERGKKVLGPLDAPGLYAAVYGVDASAAVDAVAGIVAGQRLPESLPDPGGVVVPRSWSTTSPDVLAAAEAMSAAGLPVDPELGPPPGLAGTATAGRAFVRWLPGASVSGRWGAYPDALNMPGEDRLAICAPPGRLIVEADLRAAGLVASAALSADPGLRWAAEGADPYLRVASVMLGRREEEVDPAEREVVKQFVHRALDGAGQELLAAAMSPFPLAVSQEARVRWRRHFSGFYSWWRGVEGRVDRGEGVILPYENRVLVARSAGQAVGCLHQALIASHVDRAIVEIWKRLRESGAGQVVAMVWDSVVVEADAARAGEVTEVARRAMCRSVNLGGWRFQFRVRVTAGLRWGGAEAEV